MADIAYQARKALQKMNTRPQYGHYLDRAFAACKEYGAFLITNGYLRNQWFGVGTVLLSLPDQARFQAHVLHVLPKVDGFFFFIFQHLQKSVLQISITKCGVWR